MLLTASLIWTFLPGSMELLENGVHQLRHGHGAHAVEAGEHAHPDPDAEHGCTPAAHVCGCCTALYAPSTPFRLDVAARSVLSRAPRPAASDPSDHSRGIDHPPRA